MKVFVPSVVRHFGRFSGREWLRTALMQTTKTTRHDSTDPTASAGWRAEYTANAVAVPDGGSELLPKVGDRVTDREADGGELIVLDVHPEAHAGGWEIRSTGRTVADHNPEYRADSAVVEAVYGEDADRLPAWRTVADLRDAVKTDTLASYAFPAARLAFSGGEV